MSRITQRSSPPTERALSRVTVLALAARFADEMLYGVVSILMPTLRTHFQLSYARVGLLTQVMLYVAGVAEPINGLLIDVWRRRWLLVFGAFGLAASLLTIGAAPTFGALLVGFAIYGVASGPLAHTADVVLVELHTQAPSRVMARVTSLSAVGELFAPALVAGAIWAGVDWRWLILALGVAMLPYGAALLRTDFPAPARHHLDSARSGILRDLLANVRAVVTARTTLIWLIFLRAMYTMESADSFEALWLADVVGMSQALIGVYYAWEITAALLGTLFLDRWLQVAAPRQVILIALTGMLVLTPAWFLGEGVLARFVIGAPLVFLWAMIWPIARAESLHASTRPGALTAVNSATGLLPTTLAVALLAEAVGLTRAMLSLQLCGIVVLLLIAWRWLPRGQSGIRLELGD
jgi:MFS transporter, FSR family, fosmidomycin resistance protein